MCAGGEKKKYTDPQQIFDKFDDLLMNFITHVYRLKNRPISTEFPVKEYPSM